MGKGYIEYKEMTVPNRISREEIHTRIFTFDSRLLHYECYQEVETRQYQPGHWIEFHLKHGEEAPDLLSCGDRGGGARGHGQSGLAWQPVKSHIQAQDDHSKRKHKSKQEEDVSHWAVTVLEPTVMRTMTKGMLTSSGRFSTTSYLDNPQQLSSKDNASGTAALKKFNSKRYIDTQQSQRTFCNR
jgi:hypothetical protein